MRYRIVLEIDTDKDREWVNRLANHLMDKTVSIVSNPVYLATEVVKDNERNIIRGID